VVGSYSAIKANKDTFGTKMKICERRNLQSQQVTTPNMGRLSQSLRAKPGRWTRLAIVNHRFIPPPLSLRSPVQTRQSSRAESDPIKPEKKKSRWKAFRKAYRRPPGSLPIGRSSVTNGRLRKATEGNGSQKGFEGLAVQFCVPNSALPTLHSALNETPGFTVAHADSRVIRPNPTANC
jgi:hypothetical protein